MAIEGASGSAAGGELEEKIDLSEETKQKVEQGKLLVQSGQLREALTLLAALEKRCRVGNDITSLVKVCEASLDYCKEVNDEEALINTVQTLSTRRSQKTQAVKALVHKCLPWCIQDRYTPLDIEGNTHSMNKEFRDKLLEALKDITDGKIFLEMERARLTRALATVKEQEGDIGTAADILQEVHVETYGSLSKRDKVEFILEQIRLTLGKKDYIRAAIVASKISKKHLLEESMEEYKVKFYTLMQTYHRHERNAFELAQDYHSIYSTPHVLNDDSQWKLALQSTVLFLILSPYSNHQQDMMNRINLDPNLEKLPSCQTTVQLFLKKEIINYPLPNQAEIETWPAFTGDDDEEDTAGTEESKSDDDVNMSSSNTTKKKEWLDLLHKRVIQHNIRIVSIYYRRIHCRRLAQLLNLEPDRLEKEISSMVSNRDVYAKIDRPNDIVRFMEPKSPESILSDWGSDIDKLLHLVETTTHLINKENMTQ